jgi:alpha-glucosidase
LQSCAEAAGGEVVEQIRRDGDGAPWWRQASIYQVYLRSFADGDGDGIGDIAGLRSRLDYLAALGVDALWINPWYRSPMVDAGYDVADFRDIDPLFGTLAEAEALIGECHERGLRLIADIVPNHTSSEHAWFRAALASPPDSPERARFWFRPGRGARGELPPNDWRSRFGGPAWTRITEADGSPGEWYLHLFAPEQPDLNWENPEVVAEFESILRFWLDRGIDGFRIDVAHGLAKDPALPDLGPRAQDDERVTRPDTVEHPHWDRDEVHEIFRGWRRVADSYPGERTFVAEAWVTGLDRLARYLRPGELHSAFNFEFLMGAWNAGELRGLIDDTLRELGAVGAPATWVLSNHDVPRHATRYGAPDGGRSMWSGDRGSVAVDLRVGLRRARAAALLSLALPGGVYIYQGEELGLWEVRDIPAERMDDPTFTRTGRTRDGSRVPLPWSGEEPPYGFSPPDAAAEPWLPQPAEWGEVSVARQDGEPGSTLELYRAALHIRRAHPALGDGGLTWDETAPEGVLSFTRSPGFRCLVNLSEAAIPLPPGAEPLVTSAPLGEQRTLEPDAAVWLSTAPPHAVEDWAGALTGTPSARGAEGSRAA